MASPSELQRLATEKHIRQNQVPRQDATDADDAASGEGTGEPKVLPQLQCCRALRNVALGAFVNDLRPRRGFDVAILSAIGSTKVVCRVHTQHDSYILGPVPKGRGALSQTIPY